MSSSSDFVRNYSIALAEALHEKEKDNFIKSKKDRVFEAYRALCFDDPRVSSDEDCKLLANSLVKGEFALSERLVDGILQATGRFDMQPLVDRATDEKTDMIEKDGKIDHKWTAIEGATSEGYATLAVAVFLQIPLKCCQASNLQEVQTLLGSFQGPEKRKEKEIEESTDIDLAANIEKADDPPTRKEETLYEEYEEVWAAESDPSDFCYESSAQQIDWKAWDDVSFDPQKLSQPSGNNDWSSAQHAVANLLYNLSHSKFVPINSGLWKRLDLSDLLTQLTLTLLLSYDSKNPMLKSLREWSVQPINVMRDRILMMNDNNIPKGETMILRDYLSLVQSLIAADANSTEEGTEISTASTVGLASLSSICTQAKYLKVIPEVRKCVIECCEDLCSPIERALNLLGGESEDHTVPFWINLTWVLLPLLELISNVITLDGSELDPTSSKKILTSADAQWLLNSGFFRQLILLYVKSGNESGESADVARQHLLQALQFLSLQSMVLLGKYAWRVPELNKLIHEEGFIEKGSGLNKLLWSIMGVELSKGRIMLQMRNSRTPTSETCVDAALEQWKKLCVDVEASVQTLVKNTQKFQKEDHMKDVTMEIVGKKPIHELNRFSNCLKSCSALSEICKSFMTAEVLQQSLHVIRQSLSSIPPVDKLISKTEKVRKTVPCKTSENDKVESPPSRLDHTSESEIAMVRKSLKVITMAFRDQNLDLNRMHLLSKMD